MSLANKLGVPPPVQVVWGAVRNALVGSNALAKGTRIATFPPHETTTAENISRAIHEIGLTVRDIGAHAIGNPFGSSVLVRDVPVIAGQTVIVTHGLGHAPTTWTLCRPRPSPGATPANGVVLYESNPQPLQVNTTKQLQFQSTATGTVDILFG